MIDRETALDTLRLTADADRARIISAYNRLARRYPLQQFPERHASLLQAKELLLNPEMVFKSILTSDKLEMGWLNAYSKTSKEEVKTDVKPNPKQCLEALLRPYLINIAEFFEDGFDEQDLEEMLEELGPGGVQELIDELGSRFGVE